MARPLRIEYEIASYLVIALGEWAKKGDLSYSGVVKAYQRLSISLGENKLLKKEVEDIRANLSQAKG